MNKENESMLIVHSFTDPLIDQTVINRVRPSNTVDETVLLNEIGIACLQRGRDDEAKHLFSQALLKIENNSRTSAIQLDICAVLQEVIRNIEAKPTIPHDDQSSKSTLLQQKIDYDCQQHDYDEGMYYYAEVIHISEDLDESTRSAALLYNMAHSYIHDCQWSEAIKWIELSLLHYHCDNRGLLDANLSVKIYHNLGYCLYKVGKSAEATNAYRAALCEIHRGMLGELPMAAAISAIAILHFHGSTINTFEVLGLLHSCLLIYEKLLGKVSKEVATTMNNIGRVYSLRGHHTKALEFFTNSFNIRCQVLRKDSIDVAATIYNIGQTFHQLGQLDSALIMYEEFLEFAKNHLQPNHHELATVLRRMAEIYQVRGKEEQTISAYIQALEIRRKSGGRFHPEIAVILNKLGNFHFEKNALEQALKCYEEGLLTELVVFDPYHPNIIITLSNIAQLYLYQGNHSAAMLKFIEIHALQLKIYGPNSVEVANSLVKMGLLQFQLKCYDKAFDLYQEALRIQRYHSKGEETIEIASTLNSIGLVLFNQGDYEVAETCFTDSLQIRLKLLGPDHKDVSIVWYNIATIRYTNGDEDRAIQLYKEALRVERTALGPNHPDVLLTLQHLGVVHHQLGEFDLALKYFNEAKQVGLMCDRNSIQTAKIFNLMGNIYLQTNDIEKMMECYISADRIYRQQMQRSEETLIISGFDLYTISRLHPSCAPVA